MVTITPHPMYVGPTKVVSATPQDMTTTEATTSGGMALTTAKAVAKKGYDLILGWVAKLQSECPELRLLVIGETGVGKSTLINNLLGEEVADEGHSVTSETSAVNCYKGVIEGVPVKVYDTPGLADSRSDRDEEYLEQIKKLIETEPIHLIIYCLKMNEPRMRRGIIHTFQQYTQIGVDWKKTAIALTFADDLKPPPKLKKQKGITEIEYFKEKLAEWRVEIPKVLTAETHLEATVAAEIKINPTTGDHEERLPNGEEWYIPFWLDVLEVLPPAARIRFVEIHKENIKYSDKETREAPELPNNFPLPPQPNLEELYSDKESKKLFQHPDDSTQPPPPKLAKKSFQQSNDHTPSPPHKLEESRLSYKPPMEPTNPAPLQATTSVTAKEPFVVNIGVSNQESVTVNPSISVQNNPSLSVQNKPSSEPSIDSDNGTMKKPVIVLEGERRERFENTIGEAVRGIAFGVLAGASTATIGATVGAVAVGAAVAPVVLPALAVGAAAGAIGAGVAKLFGWW